MKTILFFILSFFFCLNLAAQSYDRGIFGTTSSPVAYDTLAVDADSLASRICLWENWPEKGTFWLPGYLKKLSGNDATVTVKMRLLLDYYQEGGSTKYTWSSWQTLGTVAVTTTSTDYNYNISGQTWWQGCMGHQVAYTIASAGSVIKIRGKEKVK